MSRNFELIQQLEIVSLVEAREAFEPDFAQLEQLEVDVGNREWASDEALSLVQRVFLPQTQTSPRAVVFTGVNHGDGCTGICASVADTLARNGYGPVCLVEANFRSPSLSGIFGMSNRHGLADALLRDGPIRPFVKPAGSDGLWLLPCGGNATKWPNLVGCERIKPRLDELRNEFRFVLIDTPPLTHAADAVTMGQLTHGVVLVLEAASTRRESAQMATATLRSAKVPILGAVLNKRTFPIPDAIYKRI